MKSDARDMANDMIIRLIKEKMYPPEKCTLNDESLKKWFEYLEDAKIRLSTWI